VSLWSRQRRSTSGWPLKSQGQCRSTLETLANIKNPPVFARQANIAAGPQQVNNRVAPDASRRRAALLDSPQSKLLEGACERMDGGTSGSAGDRDQAVAAVGAVDGTAER
jgi:hypothetical protein